MSRSILIALLLGSIALVGARSAQTAQTAQPAQLGTTAGVMASSVGDLGAVAQYLGSFGASAVSGAKAYAGVGARVLRMEFDSVAGEMRITGDSEPLGGAIIGLAAQGGMLYATKAGGGLYTLEDTGADLAVVAYLSRSKTEAVAAVPDSLLLTGWGELSGPGGGVELVSLRDARRPTVLEPIEFPICDLPDNFNSGYRTLAAGDKAFVFYSDNYGGSFLATIKIEPGPSATILGVAEVDHLNVYDAAVAGDNLFVIDQYAVVVLDVSDPTAPELVQRYDPFPSFYPDRLTTDGRLIVLSSVSMSAGERHGLVVLDAREPEAGLPEVAHLDLAGNFSAIDLKAGRLLALGESEGGSIEVRVIDIDDTGSMAERGVLRLPGAIRRVAVDDERVFTVGRSDAWALEVAADRVDVGGRVLIPAAVVNQLTVWGDHLVAATNEGLLVLHAPSGGTTTLVGELARDPASDPHFGAHVVVGGSVYMIAGRPEGRERPAVNELWVVDLAVPSTPVLVSRTDVPLDVLELAVVSGVVVLLGNDVTMVDVSDAALPRFRGSVTIGPNPVGLVDLGRGVILAAREAGLVLVDVSDADMPRIEESLIVEESVLTVGGGGPTAFALLRSRNPEEQIARLARFDVDGSGGLERTGSVDLGDAPYVSSFRLGSIEVVGDFVLVPGAGSGLFVAEIPKELVPIYLPRVLAMH